MNFIKNLSRFFGAALGTVFCWVSFSGFEKRSVSCLFLVCFCSSSSKNLFSKKLSVQTLVRTCDIFVTRQFLDHWTTWTGRRIPQLIRHWTNLSRSNFDLIFSTTCCFRRLPVLTVFFVSLFSDLMSVMVVFLMVCLSASSSNVFVS